MELLKVKSFQEKLNSGYCGPASLKMVMSYFGQDYGEDEVALKCNCDPNLGVSAESIREAAESYGFEVVIQDNSNYEDLGLWLNRGVPVIVDWFTGGRNDYGYGKVPDGHYSVVVGLDIKNIYLQDPEIGEMRTIGREDFIRVWFDFAGSSINQWKDITLRQIIAIYPKGFIK